MAAVAGVVDFAAHSRRHLRIDLKGRYVLRMSMRSHTAGRFDVDTEAFMVVVGRPAALVFGRLSTVYPAAEQRAGEIIMPQPQITVRDSGGNVVSAYFGLVRLDAIEGPVESESRPSRTECAGAPGCLPPMPQSSPRGVVFLSSSRDLPVCPARCPPCLPQTWPSAGGPHPCSHGNQSTRATGPPSRPRCRSH